MLRWLLGAKLCSLYRAALRICISMGLSLARASRTSQRLLTSSAFVQRIRLNIRKARNTVRLHAPDPIFFSAKISQYIIFISRYCTLNILLLLCNIRKACLIKYVLFHKVVKHDQGRNRCQRSHDWPRGHLTHAIRQRRATWNRRELLSDHPRLFSGPILLLGAQSLYDARPTYVPASISLSRGS